MLERYGDIRASGKRTCEGMASLHVRIYLYKESRPTRRHVPESRTELYRGMCWNTREAQAEGQSPTGQDYRAGLRGGSAGAQIFFFVAASFYTLEDELFSDREVM